MVWRRLTGDGGEQCVSTRYEVSVLGGRASVRGTVAVRGGRHVSTRYCSGGGWTNQRVTRGTLRVSVRGRHVSVRGQAIGIIW
ncbi:hypothetical protein Tco_1574294, partial [Tanacetum coccineum]